MNNRICIYTCLVGHYDKLEDPLYVDSDVDYICFTDQKIMSNIWKFRKIPTYLNYFSASLKNRYIKIMPHILLNEYDISIYIDAVNVQRESIYYMEIFNNIDDICNDEYAGPFMFVRKHTKRNSIIDEANKIISCGKDIEETVYNQLDYYKSEGYEDNLQLTHNTILIRKHNDERCIRLMKLWWINVKTFSYRDQLSLQYCIYKTNNENNVKIFDHNELNATFDIHSKHQYKNELNNSYIDKQLTTLLITNIKDNNDINEFINYYLNIGVSKIILVINKETDLDIYYDNVELMNSNELNYDLYKQEYDWILQFDQNYFLELPKICNNLIERFLKSPVFYDYNCIIVYHRYYNDNTAYYGIENNQQVLYGSKIIKGNRFNNSKNQKACDVFGNRINVNSNNIKYNINKFSISLENQYRIFNYCYLRHHIDSQIDTNNSIAICVIGRLENNYIREFIEYYKKLGVDRIFLFDTNNELEENFNDEIGYYIKLGYVILIKFYYNIYGPTKEVMEAYNFFIKEFSYMFDWCIFIDPDEYITLYKHNSIKEYLSELVFDNFNCIALNWLNMDDNDLLYYECKSLHQRFTRECFDKYEFYENRTIKSIVNLKLCRSQNVTISFSHRCHFPNVYAEHDNDPEIKFCNNKGIACKVQSHLRIDHINYDWAALVHYRLKTIEEYCTNRQLKLIKYGYKNLKFNYEFFIKYNKDTIEKRNIYDKLVNKE